MAISLNIKTNCAQVEKQFRDLANSQVHFAVARAVTEAATLTRDGQLFQEYNKFFTVRNRQFYKLVHSVAAADISSTKRTGIAVAAIMPRDEPRPAGTTKGRAAPKKLDTSFMKRHVRGGQKKMPSGKNVAMPLPRSPIKRLKSGAISSAFKPRKIMQKNGFVGTSKRGNKIMYRRLARGKVQPMYLLTPSVTIDGGYNPLRAVRKGLKRWFQPTFNKHFRRAVVSTIERRGLSTRLR